MVVVAFAESQLFGIGSRNRTAAQSIANTAPCTNVRGSLPWALLPLNRKLGSARLHVCVCVPTWTRYADVSIHMARYLGMS